jgi:positive regulator of sigma E activity
VLRATARIYLLPVVGLVAGAAAAEAVAALLSTPEAAGKAAGIGGIFGAAAALLILKRLDARAQRRPAVLPGITRIVATPGDSSTRLPR